MIKRILQFFNKAGNKEIVIVSGLPRSGTSLMMKMLEAGGIAPVTDELRIADTDNPKGYYEFERVKKLPDGDTAWLDDAGGKAVKVITALLTHLPEAYTFRVIFMEREIQEVLASQRKMLVRRGEDPDKTSNEELVTLFATHVAQVEDWMEKHTHHVHCLKVSYNGLLSGSSDPIISAINAFLGKKLDVDAMKQVIDPTLYRNKG